MKGIVAGIKGKYIVVLGRDGSFVKMRNNGSYSIGCEIDIVKQYDINTSMLAKVSSMAAAALLVLGLGFGAYSYTAPYSYVGLDINPSMEITANIFDRIISVEGLNEDGRKLAKSYSLRYSRLDDGIAVILDKAVKEGYLKEEAIANAVIFTVTSGNDKKTEQLQKSLNTVASTELKTAGVQTELVVEKATLKDMDKAIGMGLTPGKLNLIEKAIDAEPGLKIEDLKDTPVKDIMKQIKDKKKEAKKENKQEKQEDKKDGENHDKANTIGTAAEKNTGENGKSGDKYGNGRNNEGNSSNNRSEKDNKDSRSNKGSHGNKGSKENNVDNRVDEGTKDNNGESDD